MDAEERTLAGIGLGANLGDLRVALNQALAALRALRDTELIAKSSLYRSAPLDAGGPDYLNAVALLSTSLPAMTLLAELQTIERFHGRARPFRNAPRTLDLDLLFYGDERIATPELTVPHPRMLQRAFVLLPLAEIAPHLVIPGAGPLSGWLAQLTGQRIDKLVQ